MTDFNANCKIIYIEESAIQLKNNWIFPKCEYHVVSLQDLSVQVRRILSSSQPEPNDQIRPDLTKRRQEAQVLRSVAIANDRVVSRVQTPLLRTSQATQTSLFSNQLRSFGMDQCDVSIGQICITATGCLPHHKMSIGLVTTPINYHHFYWF